jgi:hypothetical protein
MTMLVTTTRRIARSLILLKQWEGEEEGEGEAVVATVLQ